MYLLLLGLVVGLAMSPWIMGRFMSEVAFNHWYHGGGQALTDFETFLESHGPETKAKEAELLERLLATGATKEAVDEMQADLAIKAQEARKPFTEAIAVERKRHVEWYRGLMASLVLAAVTLMFLEPLFEPGGGLAGVRRRLVFGRYTMLAAWVALALAKPHMMAGTNWLLGIVLVGLAIGSAAIPMLTQGPKDDGDDDELDAPAE
jgi:hypothetical protein